MPVSKKKKHGKPKKGKKKIPQGLPKKEPAQRQEYVSNDDTPGNRLLKIGIDIGRQQVVDMLCYVLNDKEIMGKDIFGKKRLLKVVGGLNHYLEDVFTVAWGQDPETYYQRVKLDEGLRAIVGEENFAPFLERYEYIKECDL